MVHIIDTVNYVNPDISYDIASNQTNSFVYSPPLDISSPYISHMPNIYDVPIVETYSDHTAVNNVSNDVANTVAKTSCGGVKPGLHCNIDDNGIHVGYGGDKFSTDINIGNHIGDGHIHYCPLGPTDNIHLTKPIINGDILIPF